MRLISIQSDGFQPCMRYYLLHNCLKYLRLFFLNFIGSKDQDIQDKELAIAAMFG